MQHVSPASQSGAHPARLIDPGRVMPLFFGKVRIVEGDRGCH
jgi:hypothetical protein